MKGHGFFTGENRGSGGRWLFVGIKEDGGWRIEDRGSRKGRRASMNDQCPMTKEIPKAEVQGERLTAGPEGGPLPQKAATPYIWDSEESGKKVRSICDFPRKPLSLGDTAEDENMLFSVRRSGSQIVVFWCCEPVSEADRGARLNRRMLLRARRVN